MARFMRAMCLASLIFGPAFAMECSGKQVAKDMVSGLDLSGKVHVITGGDAGLGYQTALALASARANVILACRSRTKCTAAVANITRATGNKEISVIPLDLSSFRSVRLCAAAIRKQVSRIDSLINNAGLEHDPEGIPTKTEDGFDRVFQVNFLGQHLLVQELLPLLRESNARVINVASFASLGACPWGNYLPGCTSLARLPKIATTTPRGPNLAGTHASNYGITKYLEVFAAAELAKRETNITAFSLHPGVADTDMTKGLDLPWIFKEEWCLGERVLYSESCPRTPAEGASTQTYIAVAPKDALQNGKYFVSCKAHESVRDLYANLHGEVATLTYQSGIHDMANDLIDPKRSANPVKITFMV